MFTSILILRRIKIELDRLKEESTGKKLDLCPEICHTIMQYISCTNKSNDGEK